MIVLKKLILVGWVHKPQPPNGGFELRLNVEDDGTAKAVAGTARGLLISLVKILRFQGVVVST